MSVVSSTFKSEVAASSSADLLADISEVDAIKTVDESWQHQQLQPPQSFHLRNRRSSGIKDDPILTPRI